MFKEVRAFKTFDGKVFESVHDAADHEAAVKFADWYVSGEGDRLFGIYVGELIAWIKNNTDKLRPFIS